MEELEKRTYETLCELYESGCSHEEACSFLHASQPSHREALEKIVLAEGFGSLESLREVCLERARARVKVNFTRRVFNDPDACSSADLAKVLLLLEKAAITSDSDYDPDLSLAEAFEILGSDWSDK